MSWEVSESPTFVDTNTGSALYAAAESTKPAKGLSEGTKAEFCAPIAASLSAPEKDLRSSIQDAVLEINRSLGDQKWIYTRGGRTIDAGERMRRIVKGIDECAKIVDVLIQHYPDIVALVWGGVRFVLMVCWFCFFPCGMYQLDGVSIRRQGTYNGLLLLFLSGCCQQSPVYGES